MHNFGFALTFVSLVDSSKYMEIEMKWLFEQSLFLSLCTSSILPALKLLVLLISRQNFAEYTESKCSFVFVSFKTLSQIHKCTTQCAFADWMFNEMLFVRFSFEVYWCFTKNSLCYNFKRSMSSFESINKRKM